MLNLREIHKPTTLDDALKLLRQPNTVALAGGTQLIAEKRKDVRAVVDLSALGLAYIRDHDGAIAIGATTTLADVIESPILRAVADGVLAQAAQRTAASILRNQATVAGTLIGEPNGIFAVALAALDARVVTSPPLPPLTIGDREFGAALNVRLGQGALITEIVIPNATIGKRASLQTVARTPRDQPIVSVCASARVEGNVARGMCIALGGVAARAVRARAAERELEGVRLGETEIGNAARLVAQGLSPRGDYRGSAAYRREMAVVLTRRALRELV